MPTRTILTEYKMTLQPSMIKGCLYSVDASYGKVAIIAKFEGIIIRMPADWLVFLKSAVNEGPSFLLLISRSWDCWTACNVWHLHLRKAVTSSLGRRLDRHELKSLVFSYATNVLRRSRNLGTKNWESERGKKEVGKVDWREAGKFAGKNLAGQPSSTDVAVTLHTLDRVLPSDSWICRTVIYRTIRKSFLSTATILKISLYLSLSLWTF
jgi:hypothetical protein